LKIKLLLFFILISVTTVSSAEAHTAKVLDDFKFDVGWKHEPPITGEENAIEIVITLADNYEKQNYDPIYFNIVGESNEKSSEKHLNGLENNLEVQVKEGSEKKTIAIEESTEFPGVYYGVYTPSLTDHPHVNIFGTIKNMEFDASFVIEKPEQGTLQSYSIPDWIRNNALWWSEGGINDSDFVSGLQFLIKEGIMQVPQTESDTTTSEGIPSWIKNNAGWWAQGQISDDDFIKGVQFLIQNGILKV